MPRVAPSFALRASACAVLAAAASCWAQPVLEFRIDASASSPAISLYPPSIALVQEGTGLGGNVTDAMIFAWTDDALAAVPLPICDLLCGTSLLFESFGGGNRFESVGLYSRRFLPNGAPIDAANTLVASATINPPPLLQPTTHGSFQTPSLAIRATGATASHVRLAWWDWWGWGDSPAICGTPTCSNQPVGWWHVGYPSFDQTLANSGSAQFSSAGIARCNSQGASAAAGVARDLIAYRTLDGACRSIRARFEPPLPVAPGEIIIALGAEGRVVGAPAAAGVPGTNDFIVAWHDREIDVFDSARIWVRRVFADGSLGMPVLVADVGHVADQTAPAVAAFADGSFAVQWCDYVSGDPGTCPLLVQRFDAAPTPGPIDSPLEIHDNVVPTRHAIAARGSAMTSEDPATKLSSVYTTQPPVFFISADVQGRAIRPSTGATGPQTDMTDDVARPGPKFQGDAHQHTARIRSDGLTVVAWHYETQDENWASVADLPLVECDSIDFNNDNSFFDPQDVEAFLSVYGEGPCVPELAICNDIDFNNDGSLFDPCDIASFLTAYGEGGCTPCGQP